MRKSPLISILVSLLLTVVVLSPLGAQPGESSAPAAVAAIQPPVLLWQRGGCYSSWCETGWYSSPAVADLNADGKMEVIGSAYTIFVLDGNTGSLLWKVASGHDISQPGASSVGRTWPGIVVADVDNDGLVDGPGRPASDLRLAMLSGTDWLEVPSTLNLAGHVVEFTANQTGSFALTLARPGAVESSNLGTASAAYPNPTASDRRWPTVPQTAARAHRTTRRRARPLAPDSKY